MSDDGGRTATDGTPVAVDVSGDRPARMVWVLLLAGPVTWFVHFMVVYLVVEAGCAGGGPGFEAFDPPVPKATTLAATAVAVIACTAFSVWSYRRWRAGGGPSGSVDGTMAFVGFLLASFSAVAVLFVGLPALLLEC